MSDQSLMDAQDGCESCGWPSLYGNTCTNCGRFYFDPVPVRQTQAEPAEGANSHPSDAAVQAAATAMQPTAGNHQVNCPTYLLRPFDECTCGIRANTLFRARAALEAAYLVDRVDAPRPLLDSEADAGPCCLQVGTCELLNVAISSSGAPRPMPTLRLLDEWLTEHEEVWRFREGAERRTRGCGCGWAPDSWDSDDEFHEYYREHRNEAVLALLNGAES